MKIDALAVKKCLKNPRIIIILLAVAAFALLQGAHAIKSNRVEKQALLGGEAEVVVEGQELPKPALDFVTFQSRRLSHVVDLGFQLPLKDAALADVTMRLIDNNPRAYPLLGGVNWVTSGKTWPLVIDAKTGSTGVVANPVFLKQSGLKVGEFFDIGGVKFQIRGTIVSLPDAVGQKMVEEVPLILTRQWALPGNQVLLNAPKRIHRYRLFTKTSAEKFKEQFGDKFSASGAVVTTWKD